MLGSTTVKARDFEASSASSRKAARSEGSTKLGTPRPANYKRLTLDLPEELHRAIKLNAVQEGVTMAHKLRGLLIEHYGLNEPQQRAE